MPYINNFNFNNILNVNLVVNIFLHIIILFTILGMFFMYFIANISSDIINNEIKHSIDEQFNNLYKDKDNLKKKYFNLLKSQIITNTNVNLENLNINDQFEDLYKNKENLKKIYTNLLKIQNTNLTDIDLNDTNLSDIDLNGTNLTDIDLNDTNLNDINIENINSSNINSSNINNEFENLYKDKEELKKKYTNLLKSQIMSKLNVNLDNLNINNQFEHLYKNKENFKKIYISLLKSQMMTNSNIEDLDKSKIEDFNNLDLDKSKIKIDKSQIKLDNLLLEVNNLHSFDKLIYSLIPDLNNKTNINLLFDYYLNIFSKNNLTREIKNNLLFNKIKIVNFLLILFFIIFISTLYLTNLISVSELNHIFLENVITFIFVGIIEIVFFFNIALKFIPVPPSLIITSLLDSFKVKKNV